MPSRILVCAMLLLCALNSAARALSEGPETGPDVPIERTDIDLQGDPARPVVLKVSLVLPAGSGPFPLVILNHGSNGPPAESDMRNRERQMATFYFLSRGYAVALPLMRGYGGSGGRLAFQDGCRLDISAQDNARDIRAVMDQIARRPKIDARRVVMAGASLGGWNALAVGTLNDPRVKAIVNFHGGLRSTLCEAGDEALESGARAFGKISRTPSIWFYGDNDHLFPRSLWEAMHRAYVDAGGPAELVAYGKFGDDSHRLLTNPVALKIFAPRLDAFLARNGLPTKVTHPQYVPLIPPPPSHYAAIGDAEALPFATPRNLEAYRTFLAAPRPRAFFITDDQGVITANNGYDPLARGYKLCKQKGMTCRLYAFDDDVVWTYPNPPPPPTRFAVYADGDAIPYLDARGRAGYAEFRALARPKAFVIAPDGTWAVASGGLESLATAMEHCGRSHSGCKPYAVDGDVVWPETGVTRQ